MMKFRATVACLVVFICATFLLARIAPVQAASLTISTNQPIYPIWGIGGVVGVTVQNLTPNVTYYLWMQKPGQFSSNFTKLSLRNTTRSLPPQTTLDITPRDPPGTYLLSLSTSDTADTKEATAHFGIWGTNSRDYKRTETVTMAGGGFAANSTIGLAVSSVTSAFPGFPINITTHGYGEFEYSFKLSPSAKLGNLIATVSGITYDSRQSATASSTFTVAPSIVNVRVLKPPASMVQRTIQVNATYRLSYEDGSPVTSANATIDVLLGGGRLLSVPLTLVNSTSGEWRAAWTPSPSATNATYNFQFVPTNFTDSYGNKGDGTPLTSAFRVIAAKLQSLVQASTTVQRTQNSTLSITTTYPNGAMVMNVTQSTLTITRSDGTKMHLNASSDEPHILTSFKIPVDGVLGNWTVGYDVKDVWENSGSTTFIFRVEPAVLTFQVSIPNATQRTTFLNLTNTVYYPDGTRLNSTIKLQVWGENQTWRPKLNFDPANGEWSGSVYVLQNATLGEYNVTWTADDLYGNLRNNTYPTFFVSARFSFVVEANSSTVAPMTNLDLPVLVRYPNGTGLTNGFGNVTGSYLNSTGYVFTSPLAYNATNGTWNMFLFVPEQANATLSFSANDRFGNSAVAMDVYNLKIAPVPKVITQDLIIAGIVGVLVPIGLLVWALVTISTRRRKHRP